MYTSPVDPKCEIKQYEVVDLKVSPNSNPQFQIGDLFTQTKGNSSLNDLHMHTEMDEILIKELNFSLKVTVRGNSHYIKVTNP